MEKNLTAKDFYISGNKKYELEQYQAAIEDYNEAVRLDPDCNHYLYKRANARYKFKQYQPAINDYNEIVSFEPRNINFLSGRAFAKCKLKKYDEAIDDYNKIISIEPNSDYIFYKRGNARRKLSLRYRDIFMDYNKAIDLNPKNAKALYQRGFLKITLVSYYTAIDDLDESIRIESNNAKAFCQRGIAKFYLNQYQAAIDDFNECIHLKPENSEAFCYRGRTKIILEQYQAAIDDFNECIRLKPENSEAFYYRGIAKSLLEQHQAAIDDFNECIRLKPENSEAFYYRGIKKAFLKQYQAAIDDFNESIFLKPNNIKVLRRSLAKNKLKQYQQAIVDIDECIRLCPKSSAAFHIRGFSKNKLKQYQAAIIDLDEAIRLKSDYTKTFYQRGLAKSKLKRYQAAIIDLDEAIRLKSDYAKAFYQRGLAKSKLKRYQAAIIDLDEAIRLKSDYIEALYQRGLAKNKLERYQAAIIDLDKAIRLDPNSDIFFKNRGIAKFNLKQYQAAISDYNEAIRLYPYDAIIFNNRGIAKHNLEQYQEAIADYDEAICLNPNYVEAFNRRKDSKKKLISRPYYFLQRTLPWWFSAPAETSNAISATNFTHSLPSIINILPTEHIAPIVQHSEDFVWEQAIGHVGGSALSCGIFTKISDGSKWLGKADAREQSAQIEGDACCEKIASDIYAYYGVTVPEMCLANHRFVNNVAPEYENMEGIHIMVKWLDNFTPYSKLNIKAHQPLAQDGEIEVGERLLPERGLGNILAVATFINDVDVIGNSGGNIGFAIKDDYVQTIKIDPGKAFFQESKPSVDKPYIRVAPSAEPNYIVFHELPRHTQKEFILTLHDIVNTDKDRLASFFVRQGGQQFLINDNRSVSGLIDTLIQRQQQLKKIYAKELLESSDLYQQILLERPELQAKHQARYKIANLSSEKIAWKDMAVKDQPFAKGGFGTIYKAKWQGIKVAVKKFNVYDPTLKNLEDFEREARIMGGLNHINILPLNGICIESGHYSLVMQYCRRGSLFDHLDSKTITLSWSQRYQWGIEIGIGLSYLHDKHILHRDIKSHNVLIGDDNKAKFIDFGLAKIKQVVSIQSGNHTAGTLMWKAPEVCTNNGKSSYASDCYSYGMVLWELTSPGKQPFDEIDDKALIPIHVMQGKRETIPKDTPTGMANLITSLWKQEPKERPTAKESYLQLQNNRDQVARIQR